MKKGGAVKAATIAATLVALGVLGVTSATAKAPAITQSAIAGAKLGLGPADYQSLLGTPGQLLHGTPGAPDSLDGYYRYRFAKRKMSVYFLSNEDKGVVITTWNKAYRTSAAVGPCTSIRRLKKVYGGRLKPSKFSTQNGVVHAYTLGKNLVFGSNNLRRVEVVALYDGSDPHVNEPGGSLSYAGFISLTETPCS
jgi:hypothetical protein